MRKIHKPYATKKQDETHGITWKFLLLFSKITHETDPTQKEKNLRNKERKIKKNKYILSKSKILNYQYT